MIKIIGNLASPSSVVLNQVSSAGTLLTFSGAGASGMTIGGFTMNGYITTKALTVRSAELNVQCVFGGSIRINNFYVGLSVESNGRLLSDSGGGTSPFFMTGIKLYGAQ